MDSVFAALDRFFIDIIGTVIPGMIFTAGISLLLNTPLSFNSLSLFPPNSPSSWTFLIVIGYALGHSLSSVGKGLILRAIESLKVSKYTMWLIPNFVEPGEKLRGKIKGRADFLALAKYVKENKALELNPGDEDKNFSVWRNFALSITREDNSLVYRFIFISLFNLGIATNLIILGLAWVLMNLLKALKIVSSSIISVNWFVLLLMFLLSLSFLERYYEFHRRSMEVPFSLAIVKLREINKPKNNDVSNSKE